MLQAMFCKHVWMNGSAPGRSTIFALSVLDGLWPSRSGNGHGGKKRLLYAALLLSVKLTAPPELVIMAYGAQSTIFVVG